MINGEKAAMIEEIESLKRLEGQEESVTRNVNRPSERSNSNLCANSI